MTKRQRNVLVIDDDLTYCAFFEKFLKSNGFNSTIAHNGADALKLLSQEHELIILDALMPVMDGFKFLEKIKGDTTTASIPVIMLTALRDKGPMQKAIGLNADFYLTKPFASQNLLEFIHLALKDNSGPAPARDALVKHFPNLGEVRFKMATTRQELEGAMALVFKEYVSHGLISPHYYKTPLRITPFHASPDTYTFIGLREGETVITLSAIFDSPIGLPMDKGYHKEADALRAKGRRIGEAGYLAVKTGLFNPKTLSLLNFEKLELMGTIFRIGIQYGLYHRIADDACIVTNPKLLLFKYLPFENIGGVKYYGFDLAHVNKKAAIAKRMDFEEIRLNTGNPLRFWGPRYAMSQLIIGERLPDSLYARTLKLTRDDLRYFFVEQSNVLENFKPKELEYFKQVHGLNQDDVDDLLK